MDEKGITKDFLQELGDYANLFCFDKPMEKKYSSVIEEYLNDTSDYGLASDKFKGDINVMSWYEYIDSLGDDIEICKDSNVHDYDRGRKVINRLKALLGKMNIDMPTLGSEKNRDVRNDAIKFYSFLVKFLYKERIQLKSFFDSKSTDNLSCITDSMLTSRNEKTFEVFSQIILLLSDPEFVKTHTTSLIELENALNQISELCEWYLHRQGSITPDFLIIKNTLEDVRDDLEKKHLQGFKTTNKSSKSRTAFEKMYLYLIKYIIDCTAEDNNRLVQYLKNMKFEKKFDIREIPAEKVQVKDIVAYAEDRAEYLRIPLAYSIKKYKDIVNGKLQGYVELMGNEGEIDALYIAIMISEIGETLKKKSVKSEFYGYKTSDAQKSMFSILDNLDAPFLPKRTIMERLEYQYYSYYGKGEAYLLVKDIELILDEIKVKVIEKDSPKVSRNVCVLLKEVKELIKQFMKANLDSRNDLIRLCNIDKRE